MRSTLTAEAVAMKEALLLASKKQNGKVIYETDSLILFSNITNRRRCTDWSIATVLTDIDSLCHKFKEIKFVHISREANMAADWVTDQSKKGM